ncbi:hypothetical protein DQ237_08195 [Blastococcus sp. TF02-8]|nr:hypothetical protein DQ237_08195 [Blastococcus sp. TF02-8]
MHQVDESGGRRLVDLAVDAGVTATDDLGDPSITDLSTTRFELRTDTVSATRDVYGLGYGSVLPAPGASGLTPDQLAGRDRLSGLLAQLEDPASALGPDRVRGPEPYEPEAVAAVFTPFVQPSWDPVPPARPWPGPPLPGALDGPGLDCVLVTGDALGPVLDAAADATDRTPWTTSDGQRWTVVLRVLLPHENGCEDLPTR